VVGPFLEHDDFGLPPLDREPRHDLALPVLDVDRQQVEPWEAGFLENPVQPADRNERGLVSGSSPIPKTQRRSAGPVSHRTTDVEDNIVHVPVPNSDRTPQLSPSPSKFLQQRISLDTQDQPALFFQSQR